jgi:four helix bundle protein
MADYPTHKNLQVWQKSINFVKDIYHVTRAFPKEEMFGLTSQLRRAAVSIPSNIAEGNGRGTKKDLIRFLYIAIGSAVEIETQLIICHEIGLLNGNDFDNLISQDHEIIRMATALANNKKKELDINPSETD